MHDLLLEPLADDELVADEPQPVADDLIRLLTDQPGLRAVEALSALEEAGHSRDLGAATLVRLLAERRVLLDANRKLWVKRAAHQ